MTGINTSKFIRTYEQASAAPTMFFQEMFQSPPTNFFNSEEVEFDIERCDEEIAVVVSDISAGYRENTFDLYTNKKFKPPVLKESVPLDVYSLLTREPGVNPFEDQGFRVKAARRMFMAMNEVEKKIRRTMELQASQVLQNGTIDLIDFDGNTKYEIDFKAKASHLPTAGVNWDTATGSQMLDDIENMCETNRTDGLSNSDEIILGNKAYRTFIENDEVQKFYDNRRIDLGFIGNRQRMANGANIRGRLEIGNYTLSILTYGGRYRDPQTGVSTLYMDPGKVIVRDSQARMDAVFGAIPNFNEMFNIDTPIRSIVPGRMSMGGAGMDLFTNAWVSKDGTSLKAGVGARPLMIPTAIDTYSCLTTGL